DPYFRTFIALCAFAGLRLGETAGIHVDDVDFLGRTITVNRQIQGATNAEAQVSEPKYGSHRTSPVSPQLIEIVSRHIKDYGVREDERGRWLLTNGGHPFQRGSAGHYWREARARVGMEEYTLHDLRHFFASGLIS